MTPPELRPTGPIARLGEDEAAEVVRHVGGLAASGMPLPSGLRALAAEVGVGPLGRTLESLAEDVEAGRTIEEALADRGDALPPHLAGLIAAGSRSGRLADRLVEFLAYYRVGDAIRRTLWLALFYPALLIVLALGSFTMLASLLSGGMSETLEDFNGYISLPWITQALLDLSRPVATAGVWVLLGPLLVGLLTWGLVRALFRPSERRRLVLAVPLIGPVYRLTALAEFCRALAILVEAELPMPEALRLSARSARDASLEPPCARAAEEVAAGRPLADALAGSPAFPDGLPRFLRWAEGGRSLPESLRLAAGIFEARARGQAEFAAAFLAALAVASVLWWVAVVMIALVWPMLNLITLFSG
jgi:type II secretory pathway component PulF